MKKILQIGLLLILSIATVYTVLGILSVATPILAEIINFTIA